MTKGVPIPLDLSDIPTIDEGYAMADSADRRLYEASKSVIFDDNEGGTLFLWHFFLLSVIARATGLHRGVVDAVRASNPHAAFTLLRAYVELVVIVNHAVNDPRYVDTLQEMPRRLAARGLGRKSFQALVDEAAGRFPGIGHVYRELSEFAHFGASAVWICWSPRPEGRDAHIVDFRNDPHWRDPDHPRIAIKQVVELTSAICDLIDMFFEQHVRPALHAVRAQAETGG